jgi:hypothetical protein
MPGNTIKVFVSYSHTDASLVAPVVRLLRVNKSLVFQDADGIAPGTRWRDEIGKALSESNLVVVFWCAHAVRSNEVTSEWRAAIEQGKDLLPLLLDRTPLPSELGAFQWIDFRGTVGANHGEIHAFDDVVRPGATATAAPRLRLVWSAVAGIAATVAVMLSSIWVLRRAEDYSPSTDAAGTVFGEFVAGSWMPLLLTTVVVLGACLLWLRQRRSKHDGLVEASRQEPGNIEHRIAVQLEAEILRRTASAQDGGA